DVGKRPKGRRDEDRRRQVRDGDADDGGLHQICERESLLERAARSRAESDRSAHRGPGHHLSDRPRISGPVRPHRERQGHRSDDRRLAGSCTRERGRGRAAAVVWQAVGDGREDVALRRLPSPAISMGMMKFMLPNYFGIYLHDSPEKEHFTKNELWISNGCVRLEDYKRLARFLFDGSIPKGDDPKVEKEVDLPEEIPVYMTYLTAQPTAGGVQFMPDPYGRDAHLMERFGTQLTAAVHGE